ncbi:acyl-CoA-binding protein [Salmonella sp. s54395]|uniref:acyl-CoA-binding protein n=2 Tax=unclassified Salmonella TaxID=2614656 RepID=UPI003980F956
MPSDEFNQAAAALRARTTRPSDSDILVLYGLYKQVTVGNCNIAKPSAGDSQGQAKWDAWNKNKGKATADAENQYITNVNKLV